MEWVLANWEWIMLGFYTLEKIVKLSPSKKDDICLLYTSPSPRDGLLSRMPSSA